MRCPSCDKTISQKDRFCRYCGRVVTPDDIEAGRRRDDARWHGQLAQGIIARHQSETGTWGAHIYRTDSTSDYPRSRPADCPEWVEAPDWHRWFHEGLVVWDNATQRIGAISSGEAVKLIEGLLSNDAWKTTGISVVERSVWLSLSAPPPVKRSKKKAAEPAPPDETPKSKEEVREDERLRLTGAAAEEFAAFLSTQAGTLRRLAAEREKRAQEAFWSAWQILFRSDKERQAKEIDLAGRALPWQRAANDELVADVPPARATIKVVESGLWWQPTLERRGHFKSDHQRFVDLEEALQWVETELPRLRAEEAAAAAQLAEEEAADMARVAALPATDLTPFWIDPAALEPPQITYRVYIDLEYAPAKSEKMELSFGENWDIGREYFTATQIAQALQLKLTQVDVQQLAHGLGYYRIFSKVTYQDAPLAAAQAQHLWDHSAFGERFTEKKLERARYGYQEVETEYCVWLGRLEQKPWAPWAKQESRAEFLQDQAMEESLCAALDVNTYRKYRQIGYRLLSDEDLTCRMHSHRSRSKLLPPHLRAESQVWLQDHPQESLPRNTARRGTPART